MRLMVNSRALQDAIIDGGFSITEAAGLMKMQYPNLLRYLRGEDKCVRMKTAQRLKKFFGDKVIYCVQEKGGD